MVPGSPGRRRIVAQNSAGRACSLRLHCGLPEQGQQPRVVLPDHEAAPHLPARAASRSPLRARPARCCRHPRSTMLGLRLLREGRGVGRSSVAREHRAGLGQRLRPAAPLDEVLGAQSRRALALRPGGGDGGFGRRGARRAGGRRRGTRAVPRRPGSGAGVVTGRGREAAVGPWAAAGPGSPRRVREGDGRRGRPPVPRRTPRSHIAGGDEGHDGGPAEAGGREPARRAGATGAAAPARRGLAAGAAAPAPDSAGLGARASGARGRVRLQAARARPGPRRPTSPGFPRGPTSACPSSADMARASG